jgi:hypothetical protein
MCVENYSARKQEYPKHTQTKMTALSRNLSRAESEYSIPEIYRVCQKNWTILCLLIG